MKNYSREAVMLAATIGANRWIPHKPTKKQAEFLALEDREAFYGGAAGGGKSDALLMGALQYIDEPDYSAILFRRTYADLTLPGALMNRAEEWLEGTGAHWNEKKKRWEFPSGSTLTFGYLEYEKQKYRYQSAQFDYIGFDELTQFTESQYRYLFSRLRRLKGSKIPPRMRSASNPGGEGHEWVKRRFIDEKRTYIPARLEDNPYLDRDDYEKSLGELDPVTRKQLREGDWDVIAEGNKFKREWFEVVEEAPKDMRMVRYWDLAATEPKEGQDPDWTVGAKWGRKDNLFYVCDIRRFRENPGVTESLVKQTAQIDGREVSIRMEQEPGASGKTLIHHYANKVLVGYDFIGRPSTGDKVVRANPVSAAAFNGLIKLVRGDWNTKWLDEHAPFPTEGVHDDQVDTSSGAYKELTQGGPGTARVMKKVRQR